MKSEFQKIKAQIDDLNTQIEVLKEKIVKEFIRKERTLPEISNWYAVNAIEVVDVLIERQAFEDIGLIEWIEQNVSSKSLFKGVEFFQHSPEPTVEKAREILGMDESTVKFSQAYHAHHYRNKQQN